VDELYEGEPGDDVSILVVKVRRKHVLVIFTGPPENKNDDERIVDKLMSTPGRRVVCGGTSANIVAKRLRRNVDVDLETGTEEVPPTGRIEEIDLVTEGTLTLTKAVEIIRSDTPTEDLRLKIDGASRLAVLLREADEILMLVGRALNPAHQNPNLPKNLGIKPQVIQALGRVLKSKGKVVRTEYF
jgi:hypothetical protein